MIRAGVIGLGVGMAHIDGYNSHPNCEVTAVCDFSREVLDNLAHLPSDVKRTIDPIEILEDPNIDVVSIASFDNYHFEQIKLAIQNKKHVFVEKPLCQTKSEVVEIRQFLNEHPKIKLSSNLILRASERFISLKSKIEAENFGKLYYVEGDYDYGRLEKITEGWRGKLDFYSAVQGGGVHLIDLFLWLTNSKVKSVSAIGNQVCSEGSDFKFKDCVVSILEFENDIIGKMTVNLGCVHPHFHGLKIYGTKATYINRLEHGVVFTSRKEEDEPEVISGSGKGAEKGGLLNDFLDAIIDDREPLVSKEQVFEVMSICLAIDESVAKGEKVKVDYL